MKCVSMCLAMVVPAVMAHKGMLFDVNPELGVPGFPDCVQSALLPTTPGVDLTETEALANVDRNAKSLVCGQKNKDFADQITVACVGDSITAGVHSSGGNHTYPAQLGDMLGDAYKVTNLGACGSTMMKDADSPYWTRPQYTSLTSAKWDIVVIMLGTNDAKDFNWPHNCTTGPGAEAVVEVLPDTAIEAQTTPPVGTIGNGTCGPTAYESDCSTAPRGSFAGMKTFDECKAKVSDCGMANFVSFSEGWNDCSWYYDCDWEHLCPDVSKTGPNCAGAPVYHPFTSEVLHIPSPTPPPTSAPPTPPPVPELSCPFAQDYADFIKVVRTLGNTAAGPKIYLAVPPPLMKNGAYGMNQTVINSVFPALVPAINAQNQIGTDPIDVFDALGGADEINFPVGGCTHDNPTVAKCPLFCDDQSCDQCHPDDDGYVVLAAAVKAGMGL